MSENNKQPEVEGGVQVKKLVASPSRRRLIKLGTVAVPVVATLTSRPALAWHCKNPSVWGSLINTPNTSLAANADHTVTYPDETWYITNWANNNYTNRPISLGNPWTKFFIKYPLIKTAANNNFKKVTVAHLTGIGIKVPSGTASGYVYNVVYTTGSAFLQAVITAQLNFLVTPVSTQNDMMQCVNLSDLGDMALQAAPYNNPSLWSATDIVSYLYNNYLAR